MTPVPHAGKKTRAGLLLGASFPVATMALGSRFFFIARGSHIRPMGWPVLLLFLSGFGFLVTLPCAMHAYHAERRLVPAGISVVLSLSPLPLGIILLRFASWVIGFTLSP